MPTETPTSPTQPFALIVDDDGPIRNLVREILKRMGLTSMEARDGAEAVEILEREADPQLMVLDLMMPRMSGWEVIEHMRNDGRLSRVPVLVLTAVGAQRTETLPALGVRAVLNKPFDIQDLIHTVNRLLADNQPAASA